MSIPVPPLLRASAPAEKGLRPGLGASARPTQTAPDRFSAIWSQVQTEQSTLDVKRGDTLVGIVKKQYQQLGHAVDDRQAYRDALQLAQLNQIANPNLIRPGDQLQVPPPALTWLSRLQTSTPSPNPAPPTTTPLPSANAPNLLDHTLQRAADKGFLDAKDIDSAKSKIVSMGEQFGFEPEHFAMLTLMESAGMNPKATNGQCHGIIQFCEGQQRGAASVGLAGRSKSILGMNLLQQLDLVERYFKDVARPPAHGTKMTLDELYLSVLTPSARQEQRRHVPLPIAGRQAHMLYETTANGSAITRNSIVQGLTSLAQQYFPQWKPKGTEHVQVGQITPRQSP